MIGLFDSVSPQHTRGAYQGETELEYLASSARPEAARVRDLLDDWLSELPADRQTAIAARMWKPREFYGAFVELACCAIATRLGWAVTPVGESDARTPDYRCWAPDEEEELLMESTSIREQAEFSLDRNQLAVLRALEAIPGGYWLNVLFMRSARRTPSSKRIGRIVGAWLRSQAAGGMRPTEHFYIDEWMFSVSLAAGPGFRASGTVATPTLGGIVDDRDALRRAVEAKAARYDLRSPYVVFVGSARSHTGMHDEVQALFGADTARVSHQGVIPLDRADLRGGALVHGEPKNRDVSGVLFARYLNPWTLGSTTLRYYANPFARRPVLGGFAGVSHWSGDHSWYAFKQGLELRDLFSLPRAWPRLE